MARTLVGTVVRAMVRAVVRAMTGAGVHWRNPPTAITTTRSTQHVPCTGMWGVS